MFVLLNLLLAVAYVEDALSAAYCKLDIDSRVQYCFDPRYVDGLRRCNSYEPEDVIVRPGCSAAGHRSNSSLPPKRCVNGNWENLYECKLGVPAKPERCKLVSHPSVQYYCFGADHKPLACGTHQPAGTVVRPECNRPAYSSPTPLPLMRCIDGMWDIIVTCPKGDASKYNENSQPDKNESQACELNDGQIGECVLFYLCNTAQTKSMWDGAGVIDIKVGDSNCKSYIETCCRTNATTTSSVVPIKPDQPKSAGCGWRNPEGVAFRTKGDVDGATKFGEFPWACALLKVAPVVAKEPDGEKLHEYIGAGSLIHPSVVLTVAHVVADERQLNARAGEWDTQTTKEIYSFQERDVASVVVHENFNSVTLFYDIALAFLTQPMELAPNVGVACLPPPKTSTPDGTRCFATGWGQDQFGRGRFQTILQKVEVPVVGNKKCQEQLRETRLGEKFQLHSSFMCGGGEEGEYTCRAGWGAPLSCPIETEPGRYMQSGIVAWSVTCGMQGVPDVHVDVADLRDWIDDQVARKGYDHKVYTY